MTLTAIFDVKRYANHSQKLRAKQLRQALRATGGWHCHLCGNTLTLATATVDHITPLACDGSRRSGKNMLLCCRRCNGVRGTEPVHFFKMKMYLVMQFPCVEANLYERISRNSRKARTAGPTPKR